MITATLDKLTKDDLIKVIANMQDAVGWHGFREKGLNRTDEGIVEKIGTACHEHCKQTKDWDLPKV